MRTVFLSSTAKDLSQCRDEVYTAISRLAGYHCVRMEDFGAWDITPVDICRKAVANCDVFLCLVGPLFGSQCPDGMSFTQAEYQAAIDAELPRLIFMTSEDFPLPANQFETDTLRACQAAFREKVRSERVRDDFSSTTELAKKVVVAILNWENGLRGQTPGRNLSTVRIRKIAPGPAAEWLEFSECVVGIGRAPTNLIRIDASDVSWEHGQVVHMKGLYYYRHLSETNPTKILQKGRELLLRPGKVRDVQLKPGDQLTVGDTRLAIDYRLGDDWKAYQPTTCRPKEETDDGRC